MNKTFISFCLAVVQAIAAYSQETIYDYVKLGKYHIGYKDSLLFNPDFNYKAYGYNGNKPYFVQIWHPIDSNLNLNKSMSISDLFEFNTDKNLSVIQSELNKSIKEIFIRDFISTNLITDEENKFESFTNNDIFNLIKKIKTKSFPLEIKKTSKFPVIIYHHGSQSFSFENYIMAEYFASRGFIFVASNYHLPYENTVFGLIPFDQLVNNEQEDSLKFILDFTNSLTSSKNVFYIGHSWGAQMGLRAFSCIDSITGMISLETTLEFKKDKESVREMWPELYQKIYVEKAAYPFPIMFCAATGEEKPFNIFNNLSFKQKTFVTTKEDFQHNAYLSVFYSRYFIDEKVFQADKKAFKNNITIYSKHLKIIEKFIDDILTNEINNEPETIFVN